MKRFVHRLFLLIVLVAMLLPSLALPVGQVQARDKAAPSWISPVPLTASRRQDTLDLYTISGQVTDADGNPIQGVTISATAEAGVVVVKDEVGNPVSGAQVFRDGSLAGTTGPTAH
jgi:hypothetical protein